MFSSAELIEALRKRMRRSLRPERPAGEFPPGWSVWFTALGERLGTVTGATADAIIALLMLREPAPAPRASIEVDRWHAFGALWRQQWHPASADERWVRFAGYVITLIVHLVLAVLLLWLAYVRFMGLPASAPQGDSVVQVEFIGEGTPEETGGGPPQGDTVEPAAAAAAAASAAGEVVPTPVRADPQVAAASSAADVVVPIVEITRPQEPAPSAAQPLQVTEVPVPDSTFTLPPPVLRPPTLPRASVAVPELRVPTREVQVVEVPAPIQPVDRPLPQREVAVPQVRQPQAEVVVREIPTPLPPLPTRALPQRAVAVPELRTQAPQVATRDIPTPPGAAASAPATSGVTAARSNEGAAPASTAPRGNAVSSTAATPGGTTTSRSGTQPSAQSAGRGQTTAPRPGALPTARRGDDWGASDRNRPGGQTGRSPGLFNADGSPRLAPGTAAPGGGLPPATVEENIADLDRAGSWLKRKPNDFEPTSFDKYWVPNETLLAEWVRRSIKEVLIPIPGTSKKIKCSVVLLALGGSCNITDPNLQDVEATARPPPDIPFKRDLQEDQDSLGKPSGT